MSHQIDSRQLIALLFISRIFAVLTFNPSNDPTISGSVSLFASVLGLPVAILLALPILWLLGKNPGCNLLDCAAKVHPAWGKVAALLVLVTSLLMAVNTSSNFQYFLSTAVYPDLKGTIFVVCFVLVVAYAVSMGLEAFSRLSVLLMIVVLLSTLSVVLALAKDVDLAYLHSPFQYGISPILQVVYQGAANDYELMAFALLAPRVRGGGKRALLFTFAAAFGYYLLMQFTSTTTLGPYGLTQTFPIYTMMASAEVLLVQRLDALHMALWVFIAFMKSTLYLYLAREALAILLGPKYKKASLLLCGLAMLGACLFVSLRLRYLSTLLAIFSSGVPVLVTALGLPLLTGVLLTLQKKKKEAAQV